MLHNPSFALGYVLGKRNGGEVDDSAALEFGTGDFCDIWDIPVYEQSADVSHEEAMFRRGRYITDVLYYIYGGKATVAKYGEAGGGVQIFLGMINFEGSERDLYTILLDKPNASYTANWATVPAKLLVTPSLIAIVLLDETNNMPVLYAGFMRQVRSLSSGKVQASWAAIDDYLVWLPHLTDTTVEKIDDFGAKTETGYYRVRRNKGESNTYQNKNGWTRNIIIYNSKKEGLTATSPVEHPFAYITDTSVSPWQTITEFAGGAVSFGTCFPAESTRTEKTADQYYMHITSYMRSGKLYYTLLKLPRFFSRPTLRGFLPPDMCTYPHTAIDDTPGSWGQGYEEGKENGYASGYTDGEEAGKVAGKQEGYDEGHEDGYSEGQIAGYESGYAVGEQAGFESG